MVDFRSFEVDVASYPEFENLVAEVNFGSDITIVVSKEPEDDSFRVSIYGGPEVMKAPSCASPRDTNRLALEDLINAIQQGCDALVVR